MQFQQRLIRSRISSSLLPSLVSRTGINLFAHYINNGTNLPTTSRTTTIYARDHESIYRDYQAGEVVIEGGRQVRNLAPNSTDLKSGWFVGATSNGSITATTMTLTGPGNAYVYVTRSGTFSTGTTIVVSFDLNSYASGIAIRATNGSDGTNDVDFIPTQTGRHSLTLTFTSSSNLQFGIDNRTFTGGDGTSGGTFEITNIQIENVTGQSNQNPGEYVSSTVGMQTFATENGNRYANLLAYSEQFDSWPSIGPSTTVTANYGTAPDDTATADRIEMPIGGSTYVRNAVSLTGGTLYTFSLWVKSNTGVNQNFSFGVSDVIFTNGTMAEVTATTEWTRFSMQFTPNSTTTWYPVVDNVANTLAVDILAWGAQLEEGSNLGDYVATTTTQSYRVAESTGSALSPAPAVVTQPAATNLVTYSHEFDNAAWVKTDSTINANATTAPDGTLTADRLIDDFSTGIGQTRTYENTVTVSSGANVFSVFVKADQLSFVCLETSSFDAGGNAKTWFNLSTGAVGTANHDDSGIEAFANSWYRCWVQFTTTTDLVGELVIRVCDADNDVVVDLDGTSSIFIWGAQCELSPTPTSYIPTSGSAATTTPTEPVVSWPSGLGNDFVVKFAFTPSSATQLSFARIFDWSQNNQNGYSIQFASGVFYFYKRISGTGYRTDRAQSLVAGTEYPIIFRASSINGIAGWVSGTKSSGGSNPDNTDAPVTPSTVKVGGSDIATNLNALGKFSDIKIFSVPPDISDAEVLAL
jgi:hypothetical protein